MTRREPARSPWARDGLPTNIAIFATPDGWRHSILTENGARLCGRLVGLPADASDDAAKSAAAQLISGLGADLHRARLEVTWTGTHDRHTWQGEVSRVHA